MSGTHHKVEYKNNNPESPTIRINGGRQEISFESHK